MTIVPLTTTPMYRVFNQIGMSVLVIARQESEAALVAQEQFERHGVNTIIQHIEVEAEVTYGWASDILPVDWRGSGYYVNTTHKRT
jgi:hypothetical protein